MCKWWVELRLLCFVKNGHYKPLRDDDARDGGKRARLHV